MPIFRRSLSLCYTTSYYLSHQHHPHHDNEVLHAVGQTPLEATVAQFPSVTTATPLLTAALPILCSPDSSVGTVTRMRDGRLTGQNILQTGSRSHSATCQVVIGGPSSPLGKAPVGWRQKTPSSAKIKCV
jgi:hypothetical protein